jgi:diaminohydroxyphosphoribosylaminopyrimidine deaminase/5-amino-6-(5-phosphoribosylamino)uracil reductase
MASDQHFQWMERCLALASRARFTASPNPMVGCVLVQDGKVLAEGWHVAPGGPHAEVVALDAFEALGGGDTVGGSELSNAILYVNLEPCSHHGRTPPCCERIAASGVGHVVVGTLDPYIEVAGRGIAYLREKGLKVEVGVLVEECAALNRTFFHRHTTGRPFVTLKWAQSADGFMDPPRMKGQLGSIAITGKEAQVLSHGWRAASDIVVIGAGTVAVDDPALTVRAVDGPDPTRWVLDPNGRTASAARVYGPGRVAVWGGPANAPAHVDRLDLAGGSAPDGGSTPAGAARALVAEAGRTGALSVYVEGGRKTLAAFLAAGLWDEIRILQAPHTLAAGLKAPTLPAAREIDRLEVGRDLAIIYAPCSL